jgi:hypothetical protein
VTWTLEDFEPTKMNTDDRIAARLKLVDEHVRQKTNTTLRASCGLSARQHVSTTSRGMPTTKVAMMSSPFTRGCYRRSRGYTSTFGDVTRPLTPSSLRSSFEAGTWGRGEACPQPAAMLNFRSAGSSLSMTKTAWLERESITIGLHCFVNSAYSMNRRARSDAPAQCCCIPSPWRK